MTKELTLTPPISRTDAAPWLLLPARLVLFAAFQALFAAGFFLAGSPAAWEASAAWWPLTVTFANIVCLALMARYFREHGKRYAGLFRFEREYVGRDLLALLWIMLLAGPVSMLPSIGLQTWLLGGPQAGLDLFIRHLPAWAAWASLILFPVTQGLVELAYYFLFLEPRLEAQTGSKPLAVTAAALALGIQHAAVPLLFNGPYLLWRGLMFIPFAFLVGIVLRWRPRLLPYLAIVHVLMDMATAAMLLSA